jgi:hypothetical protein
MVTRVACVVDALRVPRVQTPVHTRIRVNADASCCLGGAS